MYPLTAYRGDVSPKKIMRSRHSDLIERTNRSANALRFGLRAGSLTALMPALSIDRGQGTCAKVSASHCCENESKMIQ
jgi:hypothetical protein